MLIQRRDFVRSVAASCLVVAASNSRAADVPPADSRLGMTIYSLALKREALKRKDETADLFEPMRFLDYVHGLGSGGIQVPLGKRDEAYTKALRAQAEKYGMFIEGIANPPFSDADVEHFDATMQTAAMAGARAVRTVLISGRRYERFATRDAYREAAEHGRLALERAARVAERRRVPLAVENHKDQRVDERLPLLKALSSEYVGACVDVGNSFTLLEDPLAVVEAYAPWAMSVHLKDQAVAEYDDGFLLADVALGEGYLALKRMVDILRKARPHISFCFETITRDPLKVPYLTEKYWATMPDVSGAEMARTLQTVRRHKATNLPEVSRLPFAAQVAAETENVAKSLRYAAASLGL